MVALKHYYVSTMTASRDVIVSLLKTVDLMEKVNSQIWETMSRVSDGFLL